MKQTMEIPMENSTTAYRPRKRLCVGGDEDWERKRLLLFSLGFCIVGAGACACCHWPVVATLYYARPPMALVAPRGSDVRLILRLMAAEHHDWAHLLSLGLGPWGRAPDCQYYLG